MRHSHPICFAAFLASMAMLAACANKPAPAQSVASATNEIARTGELPSQALAPGACGLFLWTQSAPVRFVFFTEAGSGKAVMNIDGTESPLELTSSRGALFGQFMTEMTFRSPNGKVGLSFKPGEMLDGGQRIEDGRLSVVSKDGWETMIPVLGVSACQPEPR